MADLGNVRILRTRVILKHADSSTPNNILRSFTPRRKELMEFKAIALVTGYSRKQRNVYQVKKLGHTLASYAIPGDSDPYRSPVRSAFWRTVTPGKPGVGGSRPGENRGYRCPEGYQFGGRFTDSRLSTCGAQLFDIPGPIGLTISALRKLGRAASGAMMEASELTPGKYPDAQMGRQPNIIIPKVSSINRAVRIAKDEALVKEIGASDGRFVRMVRRDGFVLQPVVPASVLRAIPDNRDMEGAHFIQSALGQTEFGGQELGLLSNTGVQKLTYVMPGGSNISLEKVRDLTVGERRKLGRTVNTASSVSIADDPTARLKYIANETGDGIKYTEDFVGIKNPHQLISSNGKNREKWINDVFAKKNRRMKPLSETNISTRETASNAQIGEKIGTIDSAIARINNGGTLSDISPKLLAQILSMNGVSKETSLSPSSSVIELGNRKYIYNKRPGKFEALSERFSEDVQQFLGLESPDVFLVGSGDKRKYLREDVESALIGAKIKRNAQWSDFSPEDVAKLFVADLVTDQRVRSSDSIVPMQIGDKIVPMAATNLSGGLMDLDSIEISKRQKLKVNELMKSTLISEYSKYYQSLKTEQKIIMRKNIQNLLARAKKFNLAQYRQRINKDGLSEGEKIHIDMVTKLFKLRVENLIASGNDIRSGLEGTL